jgi:GNAT superfamily N-acetyltransferase
MVIRVADAKDAEQTALVVRRSIEALCVLDHGGEEQTLRMWLNNKTPENVRTWITSPTQHILLAEENGNLLGVGGASSAGEITLNYVAPEARFKGVSKSILAALESYLHDLGYGESKLTSTQTWGNRGAITPCHFIR